MVAVGEKKTKTTENTSLQFRVIDLNVNKTNSYMPNKIKLTCD